MKMAVFEGENVWTQTKGFSSMLSSVLGTDLKLEGAIRYIVSTFFAEKSSYIAHKGKYWRLILHSEWTWQTLFLHLEHTSFGCFVFFAPILAAQVAQRFMGQSRGLWFSGRLGKTGTSSSGTSSSSLEVLGLQPYLDRIRLQKPLSAFFIFSWNNPLSTTEPSMFAQ